MNLPISIHDVKAKPIAQTPLRSTAPIGASRVARRSGLKALSVRLIETEDRGLIEKSINLEIYSAGFIDGLGGLNAELPHFEDYWDGYCIGYREYCCGLLGEEIPTPEIRASAVQTLTSQ